MPLWLLFNPKYVGEGQEREKIKIIVSFRPNSTSNRKYQKNSKNFEKIEKYHYGFISIQNRLENHETERK